MAEYVIQFDKYINEQIIQINHQQSVFRIKVHDQMPKSDYHYPPIVN